MKKYIHRNPGDPVEIFNYNDTEDKSSSMYISDSKIIQENLISVNNKNFLYIVCASVAGSACCGAGEIRFILVAGYVHEWKNSCIGVGCPVSMVEPLTDEDERRSIDAVLKGKHPALQVCFL